MSTQQSSDDVRKTIIPRHSDHAPVIWRVVVGGEATRFALGSHHLAAITDGVTTVRGLSTK
jgi:hypothetical protein